MGRGQTALEYLLMIAGGVLLSAIMMVVVNNNLNLASESVTNSDYSTRLHNYLSTTVETNDGDWIIVGSNQYSGVPGNVGIGTTSPQAKLEVNGKIMMDDATAASDPANTVATKGYVDGKSSAPTWNASGGNQYSLVSGNVGIGTTSPQAKLSVNGTTTINGTVDVSNNIITGLAAPINETDAVNKAYVDAASGSTGGNTTVIFNSTLNVGMPLQGVIDYSPLTTSYVSTIPLSLPKANCGVKITACNNPPGSLIIGADPVARIVVPNIHHATIHEVSPTYGSAIAATVDSGPVSCGIWHTPGYPEGRLCSCSGSIAQYCAANQVCIYAGSCLVTDSYECHGGASRGGCCPTGTAYDSANGFCYSCPAGNTWDTVSRICYSGANTAANRCPAAVAGETFLRWTNTVSSRTCTYYNSVAYADATKKFIMEESDKYIYCPADHPVYDSTTKLCIKANTVQTTPIGTYCATLNTYLPTSFTDVTFRNSADTAYVTSTYIQVAYNCPSGD